ncbi:MAG: carboxypeptidase-like regulatory domain-containing protein [Bacteroidota bacterium]
MMKRFSGFTIIAPYNGLSHMLRLRYFLVLIFTAFSFVCYSQQQATISGKITDIKNKPVPSVNVSLLGFPGGTTTDSLGKFKLKVPADTPIVVVLSHIIFNTERISLNLKKDENYTLNKQLYTDSKTLDPIDIFDTYSFGNNMQPIKSRVASSIPSTTDGITSIIKSYPGVHSSNELSSQYSVRGGNFDENLVYVNDIEIYRPFLVRSGQQEGLNFVNQDLVQAIQFSAGGFEAKYGDKMSSVLDIKYKSPDKFAGSAAGSLLGGSFHIEDYTGKGRLSYVLGVRNKSNQYLLNSLETKGDYKPSFTDAQTFITYEITDKWNINFLGNYSRNRYMLTPQNRETNFGTINEALRLTVYFDGQELDKFETYMGAVSLNHRVNKNLNLKFISSVFQSFESETYDIQGQYWLDELETSMGEDEFGNVAFNRGVGTYLNHARNYLDALVFNAEHKGYYTKKNRATTWGVKYQREVINDELLEWKMVDSSGFSIPINSDSVGYTNPSVQPDHPVTMQDYVSSNIHLSSNRISGYYQNTWTWMADSNRFALTAGVRSNYWDVNGQYIISPRVLFSFRPNRSDWVFKASAGLYSQPPFYREMRDLHGVLNTNLKAQQSIHFVAGSEFNFKAWGRRDFKYTAEIYYKMMNDLVTYEVDNVRIRYYAKNNSSGFARGIDMKLNGEFVKDLESWLSVSLMQTQENISDDRYVNYFNASGEQIIPGYTFDQTDVDSAVHYPGNIPRPTDQLLNISLFFQDYLPKNPTYKMHLMLSWGSGLPFGPPGERYRDTLRMPSYKRVDIGFSKLIKGENSKRGNTGFLKNFKTIWISAEVFNLLQNNNIISHLWIKDVIGRSYAIPNYLTPRQLNVKLIITF